MHLGLVWGDNCSWTETRSDLHQQQCTLLPCSFFQVSPWYLSPTFPSSHGLLWWGAEINALMASEPGGKHPIYHKKTTFVIPELSCKTQTHCGAECRLGLEDESGQGRNMERSSWNINFTLVVHVCSTLAHILYVRRITAQWPYILWVSQVM